MADVKIVKDNVFRFVDERVVGVWLSKGFKVVAEETEERPAPRTRTRTRTQTTEKKG